MVHHLDRHDMYVANLECFVLVNFVQLNGRNARIAMFLEAVRQHLKHTLTCQGVGINVNFAKQAVGTYVVDASDVVVVSVGDEDTVNLAEWLWHDLLAEIGAAVYQEPRGVGLEQNRAAQSLVVRVGAGTGITLTTDSGHTTGGSCTEKQ